MAEATHNIGGRSFKVCGESTIEHDYTFWGICRRSGLDRPTMLETETPNDFAVRLLGDLLASGEALKLLGCVLIPEDLKPEDWTPKIGEETASFLARLVQPEDKAAVNRITLSAVIDFFESGLASMIPSETSFGGQLSPALKAMRKENAGSDSESGTT